MSIDTSNDISKNILKTQRQLSIALSFRGSNNFVAPTPQRNKDESNTPLKPGVQKFNARNFYRKEEGVLTRKTSAYESFSNEEDKDLNEAKQFKALKERAYGYGGHNAFSGSEAQTSLNAESADLARIFFGLSSTHDNSQADDIQYSAPSLDNTTQKARDFGYGGNIMAFMPKEQTNLSAYFSQF